MEKNGERILIIRFGSLGDLILMTPLPSVLKSSFPKSSIDLVTKEKFNELFSDNKEISNIYSLRNGSLRELIGLRNILAKNSYDTIIDAHNVLRSNILYYSIKAKNKVRLKKRQLRKHLFIKHRFVRRIDGTRQIDRYMELARRIGADISSYEGIRLKIPEKIRLKASSLIEESGFAGRGIIALAPGAKWPSKIWPMENFIELAGEMNSAGFSLVILGGKGEEHIGKAISDSISGSIFDFTGSLSILESAAVLEESDLLVTNDSSLLHLSEMAGTPVVALFGPTVEEFGYFPRMKESKVVELDLECRPCSRNGSRPCHIDTFECMKDIRPSMVISAADQTLKSLGKATIREEKR